MFVTVGTHEQGMDRLLIELDRLIESGELKEEIVAQIGYSTYTPKNYKYKKMIGYDEMDEYVRKANIVVTHGGPGSIFHPLQYGKIPIVVPRNPDFNEHVDNHQILFTQRLEKNKRVIAVYDIKLLKDIIINYDKNIDHLKCSNSSTTNEFIKRFEELCSDLVEKNK